MRVHGSRGFTLIELMIVVVIVGILVAIAIPNFVGIRDRARVSSVKNNMHTVRIATEDFASRNDGVYPANPASLTVEGNLTLMNLLPSGAMPANPFTSAPTSLGWGAAQATPYAGADPAGGIQLNTWAAAAAAIDSYEVVGEDEAGVQIPLTLTNQ
jgi:prepilin-type N-terminal cleavage/methylation domain-containing protein